MPIPDVFKQLAHNLVHFSTRIQKGEHVLIDVADVPEAMANALMHAVREAGGYPFVHWQNPRVMREYLVRGSLEAFENQAQWELFRLKSFQAYIALRGAHNIFEQSDLPTEIMKDWMKAMKPVQDYRVNHTRWVVLRWPTPSMAQLAGMSTAAFEDFFFKVCTLDYSRMEAGMAALKKQMEQTKAVHITGPDIDLRFSIAGIPAVVCGGHFNVPDGEVFTAPVKESVEGYIRFNAPTVYQGTAFDNVRLRFEKGKIVEAAANNTSRLNAILDSDAGARYIGEFALGFNPYIEHAMRDILFDEKIAGSFHFTPGQAYESADNGNRSQIHWDLVAIQRPEYGGGSIYFDDKLIRKDGLFVVDGLHLLNPEHLV